MGPFYWFFDAIGVPDWVAQRLWLGTVLFLAGMGVRYLLRTLREHRAPGRGPASAWASAGILVATLAYMLSPYVLDYSARISVILLPWAALPWLIALAARSLRHGGWRYPAWFALVDAARRRHQRHRASSWSALGPAALGRPRRLDRPRGHASARRSRRVGPHRRAHRSLTSLWWIAGLWAEGRYGLPVLRYTESYRTVAEVSSAPEVLRGLGYWFFYGNDKLGPWIEPSEQYTTQIWLLVAQLRAADPRARRGRAACGGATGPSSSCSSAFGALTAIAATRGTTRRSSGSIFKAFTRSRRRPVVALDAPGGAPGRARHRGVPRRRRRRARPLAPPAARCPPPRSACVLVVLNLPPLWNGTMVAENLERPEDIPVVLARQRRAPRGPAATTPGCSRSRAPTSPATAGATPSTRSCPA